MQIQDGLRAGPARTYLPLAKTQTNFQLMLNTFVVRAARNGSTISGVEVETESGDRQLINVNAGGKVILAAGSLSTPRILFNSGIGPSAQIQTVASGTAGVTLPPEASWIDLPVGENLQDHPIFTVLFNTTTNLTALGEDDFVDPSQTNIDLFAQQDGPLVQSGQRLNFWSSVTGSDNTTRYVQGTCNSPTPNTIRMKVYLTHGLTSTGTLGITSAGATEFTKDPWMNTDGDTEAVTEFLTTLLSYAEASNSTLKYQSAGNSTGAIDTIISGLVTGDHFVGTAKMGEANDGTSVVDTDTKVWGTDNLYVVDASMHPDLPTGNTQAIVYVAAEAAARHILGSIPGDSSSGTGSGSGTATPSAAPDTATSPSSTAVSAPAASSTATRSCKRKSNARL